MRTYANPSVLVDSEWLHDNLKNPALRLVECDTDTGLYDVGHIPGAVRLDWQIDLTDRRTRDCVSRSDFELLAGRLGIANDSTVVLYGDQHNIMACFAFWVFRMYGHDKLKVLNGGKDKWMRERRQLTTEAPSFSAVKYIAHDLQKELRATRDQVFDHIGRPEPYATRVRVPTGNMLVDDRSVEEYRGEVKDSGEYPQRYLRGGHIPGAVNLPWTDLMRADGTFMDAGEVERVLAAKKLSPDQNVIVYTRIGERAALTWFVLHELSGFKKVRIYDGSWTEWGNLVGMPIESPTRAERRVFKERSAYA